MNQAVGVYRGSLLESSHAVHVAVVDADGRLRASIGNPDLVTFFRSGAKPFQAIPLVQEGAIDRFGLTLEDLALCCGSHSGEPRHVERAANMLKKIGVDADALACGSHPPMNSRARAEIAESGLEPGRLHNNCSGKHIGMLALARVRGWEIEGYERPEHPVQGRLLAELSRWVGMPQEAIALGVDGCAAVTFALPLRQMALGYARLASEARSGDRPATYITGAMMNYPEMVAGEGRFCTDLMSQCGGRVFSKVGAEGLYFVGVPGAELGVALKVEDGANRAVAPAILAVLRQLDLISEDDLGCLSAHAYPDLVNTVGEVVGQIRPSLTLEDPLG